jgi:glutamate:Na+ symporter, ESS family
MIDRLTDAQTVGLALAILGVTFAVGWLVRSRTGFLRALFIPSSIVAGFLVLLLGPQVLGRLTRTNGLFPSEVLEVWRVLPGLLINVVFGAIMIGKTLPKPRQLWHAAAPHALFGTFLSLGQFALAGLAVLSCSGRYSGCRPRPGHCSRCRSPAATARSLGWANCSPMSGRPTWWMLAWAWRRSA